MKKDHYPAMMIPSLVLLALVMTMLTQVGGILLLGGGIAGWWFLRQRMTGKRAFWTGAAVCYLAGLLVIVPLLARPFGRQSLPWFATSKLPLRPRSLIYPLTFRNYAKPELIEILKRNSVSFAKKNPGAKVDYLDACFPFPGVPMLPHLSHKDGKKVDLCFVYKDRESGCPTRSPSAIGYWIYEQPRSFDKSYPANLLRWDMSWIQGLNRHRVLDEPKSRELIAQFSRESRIEKMFLEPHLQQRLGVGGGKVRFQSVRAARHDDHIHLQIR